jgi:acetyl-CoA carboxylase carboxyl transferase subunit alpha
MIVLEFEKPIFELDAKIRELKSLDTENLRITEEVKRLEHKRKQLLKKIYSKLSPWEKTLVARHQQRPQTSDYISALTDSFIPLSGDRLYGDDLAITAGIGIIGEMSVAIIGHEKGKDTQDRISHNFGMPHPEGYRKACRIMELADKFNIPLITFINTAGAYPGVEAEERGQAEAIARCIEKSLNVNIPIITTIIGEGGSGGAVALAVANIIFMLEYSIYSVISPEGCASILYRDPAKTEEAANALKFTAQDLLHFKVIDEIINEPVGGAHKKPDQAVKLVCDKIKTSISQMKNIGDFKLHRNKKFLNFSGNFEK